MKHFNGLEIILIILVGMFAMTIPEADAVGEAAPEEKEETIICPASAPELDVVCIETCMTTDTDGNREMISAYTVLTAKEDTIHKCWWLSDGGRYDVYLTGNVAMVNTIKVEELKVFGIAQELEYYDIVTGRIYYCKCDAEGWYMVFYNGTMGYAKRDDLDWLEGSVW